MEVVNHLPGTYERTLKGYSGGWIEESAYGGVGRHQIQEASNSPFALMFVRFDEQQRSVDNQSLASWNFLA